MINLRTEYSITTTIIIIVTIMKKSFIKNESKSEQNSEEAIT
jgi:hypothetical protein